MNIDAEILNKYWQIESNNVQKELYSMTKCGLSQIYKLDSAFENQLMESVTSTD